MHVFIYYGLHEWPLMLIFITVVFIVASGAYRVTSGVKQVYIGSTLDINCTSDSTKFHGIDSCLSILINNNLATSLPVHWVESCSQFHYAELESLHRP